MGVKGGFSGQPRVVEFLGLGRVAEFLGYGRVVEFLASGLHRLRNARSIQLQGFRVNRSRAMNLSTVCAVRSPFLFALYNASSRSPVHSSISVCVRASSAQYSFPLGSSVGLVVLRTFAASTSKSLAGASSFTIRGPQAVRDSASSASSSVRFIALCLSVAALEFVTGLG